MKKYYKNWFVHNTVGHPLMQILNMCGKPNWAKTIHDGTLPSKENK